MVANTGAVVMLKHPFFATRFAAFTIVGRVRELDRLECASLASMAAPNVPTATHSAPGSASGGPSRPLPDPDLAGYSPIPSFLAPACFLHLLTLPSTFPSMQVDRAFHSIKSSHLAEIIVTGKVKIGCHLAL